MFVAISCFLEVQFPLIHLDFHEFFPFPVLYSFKFLMYLFRVKKNKLVLSDEDKMLIVEFFILLLFAM